MSNIKDFILKYNPYFDKGFDNVRMDDTCGYVLADGTPVFPADDIGNYFYLRLPSKIQYDYSSFYSASDNKGGVGLIAPLIIVAAVRNADSDQLGGNLITTIANYLQKNSNTVGRFTDTLFHSEDVVLQELSKLKKENIDSALERIPDDLTLVSISMTITVSFVFQNLNCITTPCLPC